VSLLVGLTGVALIFAVPPWRDGPIDLWGTPWLVASVVWFVAALAFSTLFQSPNSARFARAVAAGVGAPATGGFAEPPREVATLSKRLQVGGALLTISTIGILVLMVWQPGA